MTPKVRIQPCLGSLALLCPEIATGFRRKPSTEVCSGFSFGSMRDDVHIHRRRLAQKAVHG